VYCWCLCCSGNFPDFCITSYIILSSVDLWWCLDLWWCHSIKVGECWKLTDKWSLAWAVMKGYGVKDIPVWISRRLMGEFHVHTMIGSAQTNQWLRPRVDQRHIKRGPSFSLSNCTTEKQFPPTLSHPDFALDRPKDCYLLPQLRYRPRWLACDVGVLKADATPTPNNHIDLVYASLLHHRWWNIKVID